MKLDMKKELRYVKTINNNNVFERIDMTNFSFYHKSYKRCTFSITTINKKRLTYCAFTASKFINTVFNINEIINCNMQNCIFKSINFDSTRMLYSTTFDNSVFINCRFNNLIIKSCNFTNAKLINCSFKEITFLSSNFDNCTFDGSNFEKLEFTYMNIDYSYFKNCEFNNSILSAYQLPYIYGFEKIINNEGNFVRINGNLFGLHEYSKQIASLLNFYNSKNEVFPIVNILCYLNQYDEAEKRAYDYCLLKTAELHFVELKKMLILCNNLGVINYEKRRKLIAHLDAITNCGYEVEVYKDCKDILLDYTYAEEIQIETGLEYNDVEFIDLVAEIDSVLTNEEKENFHTIKYNHKSPVLLCITFTEIAQILGFISSSITILALITKAIQKIYNKAQNSGSDNNKMKEITITRTYYENGQLKKETKKITYEK